MAVRTSKLSTPVREQVKLLCQVTEQKGGTTRSDYFTTEAKNEMTWLHIFLLHYTTPPTSNLPSMVRWG